MHIFSQFRQKIIVFLQTLNRIDFDNVSVQQSCAKIVVEPPKESAHGDIATNAVLVLAKLLKYTPKEFADLLIAYLQSDPIVHKITFVSPGFINIELTPAFWQDHLRYLLKHIQDWPNLGEGEKINLEYVSANPTGPLHAGHARGAAFGDVLANLLIKTGHKVTKEYFINDGGGQIETLAQSLYARYTQVLNNCFVDLAPGLYPGEYLIKLAQDIVKIHGEKWKGLAQDQWLTPFKELAVNELMKNIQHDLQDLGVYHDVFVSEEALVKNGKVEEMINFLEQKKLVYRGILEQPKGKVVEDWEPREQLLFCSTLFGDDCDRPLQKSDGSWTYFAKDIAYHYDKFQRGFNKMINIFGADHGGYITRLQSAVQAISDRQAHVHIKVNQLVNFMDKGLPLKMSKRSGTFITLAEVLQAVGKDVVRFIMLMRRNEMILDFDFDTVQQQTKDNPIFYIQYAHARIHSVNRMAIQDMGFTTSDLTNDYLSQVSLNTLTHETELTMIKKIADWPRQLEIAVHTLEPHRLAFYLYEVASVFHGLWNKGKDQPVLRFLNSDDRTSTKARLALINAVGLILAKGLEIFGIEAVKEMR